MPSMQEPPFRINVLGKFEVWRDGQPITPWRSAYTQQKGLLACLACCPRGCTEETLWAFIGTEAVNAHNTEANVLPSLISKLRDALAKGSHYEKRDLIKRRRGLFCLNEEWFSTDLNDLEGLQIKDSVEDARKFLNMAAEVLPDYDDKWVEVRRGHFEEFSSSWLDELRARIRSDLDKVNQKLSFSPQDEYNQLTLQQIAGRTRFYVPSLPLPSQECLGEFFENQKTSGFWPQRVVRVDAGDQQVGPSISVSELVLEDEGRCLLLIGEGGQGKSCNLDKLFYDAVQKNGSWGESPWSALLFPLSVLRKRREENGYDTVESIEEAIRREFSAHFVGFHTPQLKQDGTQLSWVILLDGLNEIPDNIRHRGNEVVENIRTIARQLAAQGVNYRIVVTCRRGEEQHPESLMRKLQSGVTGPAFTAYHLLPLSMEEARQKIEQTFQEKSANIIAALGSNASALLTNPLLLRLVLLHGGELLREKRNISRCDLYERTIIKLLQHDLNHPRLTGVLYDVEGARRALETLAAELLYSNGGAPLFASEVAPLLWMSIQNNRWGASNWWHELQEQYGRNVPLEEVARDVEQLSLLFRPSTEEVSFLHDQFRDYLLSGRLFEAVWRNSKSLVPYLEPNWEEGLMFALERVEAASPRSAGSKSTTLIKPTEPLLQTIENREVGIYERRRALEIWARFAKFQTKEVERVFNVIGRESDRILLDTAGHAIRRVLLREPTQIARRKASAILEQRLKEGSREEKIAACKISRNLGRSLGTNLTGVLVANAEADDPAVSVAALLAINDTWLDEATIEAVIRCCSSPSAIVRYTAYDLLLAVFRRKRSFAFRERVRRMSEEMSSPLSLPQDRYAVVRWLGASPMESWTTHLIVDQVCAVQDSKEGKIVRWMAARCLYSYFHRRHLSQEQWDDLATIMADEGQPAPLRAVLKEITTLHRLYDIPSSLSSDWPPSSPVPLEWDDGSTVDDAGSIIQTEDEPELWKRWRQIESDQKATYGQHLDLTWEALGVAYDYFELDEAAKESLVTFLLRTLRTEHVDDCASVVRLSGAIGIADELLLNLRLTALNSQDANVRYHAAYALCEHHGVVGQVLRNIHDLDHATRWNAAATLFHIVGVGSDTGPKAEVLSIMLSLCGDTNQSALLRAFLVERLRFASYLPEVREAFVRCLTTDPDEGVCARALYSFQLFGRVEDLPKLERFLGDRRSTLLGTVGELAASSIGAVQEQAESLWDFPSQ